MQINNIVRQDQVRAHLGYDIYPLGILKSIGTMKGILENPFLKIKLTKANSFWVTSIGDFLEVRRKGRATLNCQPEATAGKKQKKNDKKKPRNPEIPVMTKRHRK